MSDVMEKQMIEILEELSIAYVCPDQTKGGGRLDFYLYDYDLYVELKTYGCERLLDQLNSVSGKNVLVLVGPNSVSAFKKLLVSHATLG